MKKVNFSFDDMWAALSKFHPSPKYKRRKVDWSTPTQTATVSYVGRITKVGCDERFIWANSEGYLQEKSVFGKSIFIWWV